MIVVWRVEMKNNIVKDKKCLNVGVLGCGIINQAAHFIGASKAKNIHLYAICDVAEVLLYKMAAIYNPDKIYKDYEEMLQDPQIDAVIIGIADQFHVPCARQAIQAGKHVFIEKPMGVSTAECQALAQEAEAKQLKIQIGHMKRFDPGLQYAKTFLEETAGQPVTYKGWYCDSVGRYTLTDNVMPILYTSDTMKKPSGNPKADKEKYYLLGHGSHLFDTALYLMGPIKRVRARHQQNEGLYAWLIDCDFESGAMGVLDLTIAIAQRWHEGCEIYATEGTVFAKTYNPWEFRASEVTCYDKSNDLMTSPAAYDGQFYRRELESFAACILEEKPIEGAGAQEGIMVMKALIATYESVKNDGKWINLKEIVGAL